MSHLHTILVCHTLNQPMRSIYIYMLNKCSHSVSLLRKSDVVFYKKILKKLDMIFFFLSFLAKI